MNLGKLTEKQNPDGGWPHVRGRSSTEPTVYATLAFLAAGEDGPASRGLAWLGGLQRPDGGWPPQAGVDQSTWVTALVALLPPERLGLAHHARALQWVLSMTGMESTPVYRLRQWMLGNRTPPELDHAGWPWVPGTAAWVAPTAFAVLALEKAGRQAPSRALGERVAAGRRFLLSRACPDGGWNHGSVPDLADRPVPYPEVTGLVLAALRGVQSHRVERGLAAAESFLKECRSGDALNWLRLGLAAHDRLPDTYSPPAEVAYRTISETCLGALAGAAPMGHGVLWG